MRKRCSAGRDRGFTLLELLVVLAIVAALLTLLPAVMAGIPGFRFRAATAQLADTLRQLHEQALRTGVPAVFVLDAEHRRFGIGSESALRPLPEVVETVVLTTASPLRPGAVQVLRFFPDGSAIGGTLQLRHGGRTRSIGIDWLTGRVTGDG